MLIHAQKHAEHLHVRQYSNTRKHTPEHLLVACVFVHAQTHANTQQSTCMHDEGSWCLGNFAALHWSSSFAHQHQLCKLCMQIYRRTTLSSSWGVWSLRKNANVPAVPRLWRGWHCPRGNTCCSWGGHQVLSGRIPVVVVILYFASDTKERVRHPVCLSMLKHIQTHARALVCCLCACQCANKCKHTPEHLLVNCVLIHAQTNTNTRKHTRQRSSLLSLCLYMLKNTQSSCMFIKGIFRAKFGPEIARYIFGAKFGPEITPHNFCWKVCTCKCILFLCI